MKSLKKVSLADQVYDKIVKLIHQQKIKSGERVVIDKLAKEYGVSLIPVREALARLHAQGMLELVSNRGYRVSSPPTSGDFDQLFRARLAIEFGALYIGFDKVNTKTIERLNNLNRQIEKIDRNKPDDFFNEFEKLNVKFHKTIISLSASTFLMEVYEKMGLIPQTGRRMYKKGVPDIKNNIKEHDMIINALKSGEKNVALEALEGHILGGLSRLKTSLDD